VHMRLTQASHMETWIPRDKGWRTRAVQNLNRSPTHGHEGMLRILAVLSTFLYLHSGSVLQAQTAARPLPTWSGQLPPSAPARLRWAEPLGRGIPSDSTRSRSHTGTGLLIGAGVGVAATTIFLIGFCDDPDTECGIDEVGRATLFIAVPTAALGALIGSLIRTEVSAVPADE
jgi:hypothetical protein